MPTDFAPVPVGRGFSFWRAVARFAFDAHQQNINHISWVARLSEWGP
jgi:hypothetical protein